MLQNKRITVYVAKKNAEFQFDGPFGKEAQVKLSLAYGNFRQTEFINVQNFPVAINANSLFFADRGRFEIFKRFLGNRLSWLASGFQHEFIIRGIGYRYKFHRRLGLASLLFKLGYGHKVLFPLSPKIEFRNNKRYDFIVTGLHKGVVKDVAEQIRLIKVTDPYKGKGIKYYQTPLKLKVGKVR